LLIMRAASALFILSAPGVFGSSAPMERLVQCDRYEAEFTYTFTYSLPGEAAGSSGSGGYARRFKAGDEKIRSLRPSDGTNMMGVVTTIWTEFSEKEVTFRIREVPGPDHATPYEVIVRAPFEQNVSGVTEDTHYEVVWKAVAPGEDLSPHLDFSKRMQSPPSGVPVGPVVNAVTLSPHELMMLPHDARLAYDVQHNLETGSGDWVRLQARGPDGEVSQTFRIQVVDDPGGHLGTAEVASEEVQALCAPYLRNSLEKRGEVQTLKRRSGDVYYCVLGNAAFPNNPMPPAAQFQYLFVGVFRISDSVAFVFGNLSEKDSLNFRMMKETLGRIHTLPILSGEVEHPQ
jgi:hypothetical protein